MRTATAFAFVLLSSVALADADAARKAMQAGNFAEAYCLWRTLAEAGDADAQYNLGWMYHNGYGLAIDDRAALRWWDAAAESGFADALYAIGNLHRFGGRGVPKDPPRAVDYYVRAAQRGDDESALLLRTLIARNDRSVAGRRAELVKQHADALGAPLVVRRDGTGFRKTAAAEARLMMVFAQGKRLVELSRRSNGWVQAGDPDDGRIGWVRAALVGPAP
jgi:uncharacterized protein